MKKVLNTEVERNIYNIYILYILYIYYIYYILMKAVAETSQ